MSFTRLLLLGLAMLVSTSGYAQALYEGKLGPIKYDMQGVSKAVQPRIRNAIREHLASLFSGQGDVVYRIDFKVRAGDLFGESPDKGTIGMVHAEWRVTMELSRYLPDKESLAVASFPLWTNLLTTQYGYHYIKRGGPLGTSNQQYQLIELLPPRMAIALRDFRGEDVSAALARFTGRMDTPVDVTGGVTKAFSGFTVGVSAVGKAGMSVLEVIGDPAVASAIHDGLQQASRDMAARDREIQRRNAEIQAMVYEARNESIDDLRRRQAVQRQRQTQQISMAQTAPPAAEGRVPAQRDTAREACLARGAQWDGNKRICRLERSVAERRRACESSGGVLLEQDYICWRGTAGGGAYVSENLAYTATDVADDSDTPGASSQGLPAGPSASASAGSGGRDGRDTATARNGRDKEVCEPVNQQGVRIPMTRIPQRYHCYMFSDERALSWGASDMTSSAFFYEASSEDSARSDALTRLRNKAVKQCKQMGFDASVSLFGQGYSLGELVRGEAENCRSSVRMGSTFWMCDASGSFRCGQPQ